MTAGALVRRASVKNKPGSCNDEIMSFFLSNVELVFYEHQYVMCLRG